MQWITVIGTLSGGILGVVATLLVDRVRAKRERVQRLRELRREVYARYLEALTETDGALQILAWNEGAPVDRTEVMATFRANSPLAIRYQVDLVASPAVVDAATDTYRRLRAMREAIATVSLTVGHLGTAAEGSAEWRAVHDPYIEAINNLRIVMRKDVQNV